MEMKLQNCCGNCGGTLTRISDTQWKCDYCASVFEDMTVQKHVEELRDLLDNAKREQISNLRRNLYNSVNAHYISSQEIKSICFAIKELLPDDFQANFYYMACTSNGRTIAKRIREIEIADNLDMVEQMIKFLIKSIQEEYLTDLIDLIERAFKRRDLQKYNQYATMFSEEAEKVKLGIYETTLPRDVFVAYSSKDMKTVLELVEVLEDSGISCFVASRNLKHGKGSVENYNKALEEAMDNCTAFVFVSSMSSRNLSCDAVRIEIPYIKKRDVFNSPPEFKNNYAAMPAAYKKPRVEFRLEESVGMNVADRLTNEFFNGYERVYTADEVAMRIGEHLMFVPDEYVPVPEVVETPKSKTKICVACGAEVAEDSRFCPKCGKNDFVNTISELVEYNKLKLEQELRERESAERARREQEEKERREAAERARREQEEKERREAAERARREQEEKERREREEAERARRALNSTKCTMCGGEVEHIYDGHYYCIYCGSRYVKNSSGYYVADTVQISDSEIFDKAYAYYNGQGVTRNYSEAVRLYTIAANMGNVAAQCNLGLCYETGNGVPRNYDAAVKWYQKAAAGGSKVAQRNLGYCYQNGHGVRQDYTEAFNWYKKAADQGYATAQHDLGVFYENGWGVRQDYYEAIKWYRKSADQGNKYAQRSVGYCYQFAHGVAKDYYEAARWYRKSADQGYDVAENDLGVLYENGWGVTQNLAEAARWYRLGAEHGNKYAQRAIGYCYQFGRGVAKDYYEAVKWYRMSAEQGNATAQNDLAVCYTNGWGVPQDHYEAIKWYRKSADQGNKFAQRGMGYSYQFGRGVAQDYYEAARWYRKSADQGNRTAQNDLGVFYENGWGVPKDLTEAIKWYRKAAENGDEYAKKSLTRLGVRY